MCNGKVFPLETLLKNIKRKQSHRNKIHNLIYKLIKTAVTDVHAVVGGPSPPSARRGVLPVVPASGGSARVCGNEPFVKCLRPGVPGPPAATRKRMWARRLEGNGISVKARWGSIMAEAVWRSSNHRVWCSGLCRLSALYRLFTQETHLLWILGHVYF